MGIEIPHGVERVRIYSIERSLCNRSRFRIGEIEGPVSAERNVSAEYVADCSYLLTVAQIIGFDRSIIYCRSAAA